MPNPVIHFEFAAHNLNVMAPFYHQVFGWSVEYDPETEYSLVSTNDEAGIDGGMVEAQGETPSGLRIYIEVDDLEQALAQVEKGGGMVVEDPSDEPGMVRYALIADPEGNVVGLVEREG